ncbi:B-box zinc finger protein 23-like [Corylus avellana]|uniref:B-box zinc finger protein 23-like n=1 Tax=Corylus avellana TaxID=13451 RepID=UPI00286CE117|nr:B-box zinc finger protein 23-like [Corylus avellana]
MKIQCDVCEKVEAEVLCCADEAVLCRGCDHKVHAANKLSQKHERVLLLKDTSSSSSSSSSTSSSSSHAQLPPCDICKERNGYFFCIEDRALFCKHCDVSTHMGSPFASSHRRFLITGVKVALQASINTNDIISSPISTTTSFNFPADNESRAAMAPMNVEAASTTETRATFSGAEVDPFAIGPSNWLLNEMFDPNDFNYYEFSEVGSSRISTTP